MTAHHHRALSRCAVTFTCNVTFLPASACHHDVPQNVGGGNRFALGEYYKDNETWVTDVATATIDYGPNSNWCQRPNVPRCFTLDPTLSYGCLAPGVVGSHAACAPRREYAGFVGAVAADKDRRFMNIGWETGGPPMMSALNHVSRHPSTSPWSHDGSSGVDVYPHEAQHAYTQLPEVRCMFMQVTARALQN